MGTSQGGEERKSPNGGTAQGEEGTHLAVAKPSNLHPLSTPKQPQQHPQFLVKENNEPRARNLSKPPVHLCEAAGTGGASSSAGGHSHAQMCQTCRGEVGKQHKGEVLALGILWAGLEQPELHLWQPKILWGGQGKRCPLLHMMNPSMTLQLLSPAQRLDLKVTPQPQVTPGLKSFQPGWHSPDLRASAQILPSTHHMSRDIST